MSQQPDVANGQVNYWCAGMPLVERTPFSISERLSLGRTAMRLLVFGVIGLPLAIIGFLVGMGFFTFAVTDNASAVTILLIFVVLLLSGVLARGAWKSLQRARLLRQDLREGYILHFEGCGSDVNDVPNDVTLYDLRTRRLVEKDSWPESLNVLPVSHFIRQVDEKPVSGWMIAHLVEAVEPPSLAYVAKQWLETNDMQDDSNIQHGQRELSESEKTELTRFADKTWRRALWPAMGLTLWSLLMLILCLLKHHWPGGLNAYLLGVLLVVTAIVDQYWYQNWQLARRIYADITWGFVVILHGTPEVGTDEINAEEIWCEFMIQSGLLWTENGRPAVWRRTGG